MSRNGVTPQRHVPWAVRVHVVFGGTTAFFAGVVTLSVLLSPLFNQAWIGRWFAALMTVMFASAGIGNIRARRRSVRLLAHGRVGYATLADKTEVASPDSRSKLFALRFTFEEGGVERTIELRTTRPKLLTDDRSEQIVYRPEEPEKAELVDALPGQPRVSIDGTISAEGHLLRALAALGLFCLSVLVCLVGLIAWLI